jgi:hypothetical protein
MRPRKVASRRCSYIVAIETPRSDAELTTLAHYFSELGVAGCDVLVLDTTAEPSFDRHSRILRWVARHESVRAQHRSAFGHVDFVRAAADRALAEKVIVTDTDVRFSTEALDATLELLDAHEAVEVQEYLDPLPWWGAIDAARMLLRRGIDPEPSDSATYAFQRGVARSLRSLPPAGESDDVRRLVFSGVEVLAALDVFVKREPAELREWFESRPDRASAAFTNGSKAAFFFSLVPMLVFIALAAGIKLAAAVAALLSCSAIAIALRGRYGATQVFPLRAVFFAPLWILERSLSVYVALYDRLSSNPDLEPAAPRNVETPRAASGE